MDVVTAVFLALAGVGAVTAALHLAGWVPPRYRRMLSAVQKDTATAIGDALRTHVEALLTRPDAKEASDVLKDIRSALTQSLGRLDAIPQAVGAAVEEGLTRVVERQGVSQLMRLKGQMGGQATSDARLTAEAKAAIGSDLVGPYMPVLQQFAPNIAAFLTENPGMVEEVLGWPFVQRLIQKGAQVLGSVKGGGGGGGENPFLGTLRR